MPLKIYFSGRANLFVAEQRQTNTSLSMDKADLPCFSDSSFSIIENVISFSRMIIFVLAVDA
ncbi:MAG: hypothetical protein WCW64_03480 [Phycisphaerae bacterium]|jgi:hypothetical protein